MLAAVVEEPNKLVIKDVPVPEIGETSVLLKVEAASICNATDNHILRGMFEGGHDHYPQILGHEVCGRVVQVGGKSVKHRLGERLVLYTFRGAFAEYVEVADWENAALVPDGTDSSEATIYETLSGAYMEAVSCAQLRKDEKVLIIGAGPMGLAAAGMSACEAQEVAVVDMHDNRLEMARRFGAKHTYNSSRMTSREILACIRRDMGEADAAFMCIALDKSPENDAFWLPVEALRENGRMSSLCVEVKPQFHNHRMNPFRLIRKNIQLRHYLNNDMRLCDFQKAVDTVAAGAFPFREMVTHTVTLDQLPWALDMVNSHLDDCIKIVVQPRLSK